MGIDWLHTRSIIQKVKTLIPPPPKKVKYRWGIQYTDCIKFVSSRRIEPSLLEKSELSVGITIHCWHTLRNIQKANILIASKNELSVGDYSDCIHFVSCRMLKLPPQSVNCRWGIIWLHTLRILQKAKILTHPLKVNRRWGLQCTDCIHPL